MSIQLESDAFSILSPKTIEVLGFTIGELTVSVIPYIARGIAPIMGDVGILLEAFSGDEEAGDNSTEAVLTFVGRHGERVIDLVAAALARDTANIHPTRQKVGQLGTSDFITLLMAVIRVNSGFFAHSLLQLQGAVQQLQSSGAGETPSKS
jgi:hypothetical protein